MHDLPTYNNALATNTAAGPAVLLIAVGLGAASLRRFGDVATAATTTVELDAVALPSDTVAFTAADAGRVTHGRKR